MESAKRSNNRQAADNPANAEQPGVWTLTKRGDCRLFGGRDGEFEAAVLRQFDDLDMITVSAIAIMLSDTNAKAASPYIKALEKTNIKPVLLKFLKDTYYAADIGQINKLLNKSYYKKIIKKYMRRTVVFVKRGVSDSFPKKNMWLAKRLRRSSLQAKTYIDKVCQTIDTFESVKYISALSGGEEISASRRNYKLDHLSDNYKDALIYLFDFLLTCTCISKMLFVERMIRKMPADSEFAKIVSNMAKSIDNHNTIISKSRPVYKQYYQPELGYISGDDFLYGMAVIIMVNNIKKTAQLDLDALKIGGRGQNLHEFNQDMRSWLDSMAREKVYPAAKTDMPYLPALDIGTLVLKKVALSIQNNYNLLISAFGELSNWEEYYGGRVGFYEKERDKERYLRGDFGQEIQELSWTDESKT
ncbi:MAG: hypothetical protein FWH17_07695 [Oscillospiraceae bacterium]|nr:hypothetical protein [Oscillospiraceae bacterium]